MQTKKFLRTMAHRSIAARCPKLETLNSSASTRPVVKSAIPGPKAYPVIGCLPTMLSDKEFDKQKIFTFFQKMIRTYGPVVKVDFPGQPPMVLVQRPEDVQTVHRLTEKNPVRGGMLSMKKAKYNNPYFEKKGGIVVEDGEEWWRVRSKVQVPMMKLKNVTYYLRGMDQITLDFLERASSHRDATGEVSLDFLEELQKWALESTCLVSLNQRVGCFKDEGHVNPKSKQILRAAQVYMDAITTCEVGSQLWKVYPTKVFRQMEDSLKILTEVCDKVLEEAERKLATRDEDQLEEDLDLIDHLLLSSQGLSRKDIVTFMLDIIPGGTSTTSDNAAVILYQLAKNPAAQARLQEEVDRVIGDGSGHITDKQLAQLSYARAVLKEANRLMPPMFGPVRVLQEDIQLQGYTLEKGWSVLFLNGLLGWEESVFPQADRFLPERWLRDKPLGYINPYTILPFSHGIRMCIGRRLAEQQLYIFLARIFQHFHLEWKHPDMVRDYKFVFSPRPPLKFTLTERR